MFYSSSAAFNGAIPSAVRMIGGLSGKVTSIDFFFFESVQIVGFSGESSGVGVPGDDLE